MKDAIGTIRVRCQSRSVSPRLIECSDFSGRCLPIPRIMVVAGTDFSVFRGLANGSLQCQSLFECEKGAGIKNERVPGILELQLAQ